VHLNIGVQWKPRLHYDPFLFTLSLDRMAMLSNSGLW
jgi:hypothetical protein